MSKTSSKSTPKANFKKPETEESNTSDDYSDDPDLNDYMPYSIE